MIKVRLRLSLLMAIVLIMLTAVVSAFNLPGRDFIQFWTAGRALQAGVSPYDQNFETITQQHNGWDIRREPIPFQPYFYPPWLAILMWPLSLLSYSFARAAWFVLSFSALAISLTMLLRAARGSVRPIPLALVLLLGFTFLPTLNSLGVGQPHGALLLILAALMWAIDREHDRLAGICVALLSIKPQVGLIIVAFVIMNWLLKRRWSAVRWALIAGVVLAGVSFIFVPNWPGELLASPQRFTDLTGWTFPLNGYQDDPTLWAAYRVLAGQDNILSYIPIIGLLILIALLIVRVGGSRSMSTHWLIAIACAGVFVLTPYARLYDFTILAWPLIYLVLTDRSNTRIIFGGLIYLWPIGILLIGAQGVWNVIAPYALLAALLIARPASQTKKVTHA